jgi:hypothetical protein
MMCVYDNPSTMARELWQDGKLAHHVTACVLESRGFKGGRWFPFQLNVGYWECGRLWYGDINAMSPPEEGS